MSKIATLSSQLLSSNNTPKEQPEKKLVAALDIGTNSFHIVLASYNERGVFQVISRDKETVRLGERAGDMKRLMPEAMERGINALKRFAIMAENTGTPIRAIATSAVREADNGNEFVERAWKEAKVHIEVVSGKEEARLIYLGVLQGLPVYDRTVLTIDIGGGSTETTVGLQGKQIFAYSVKLGAIRVSKKFFPTEDYSDNDVKKCREYIRGEWAKTLDIIKELNYEMVIGTSGTIETIIGMALAKQSELLDKPFSDVTNGATVSREDLLYAIDKLVRTKSIEQRTLIPGMEAKRADIILGGALIIEQAILMLDIKEMTFCSHALREGILLDSIQKAENIEKHHHLSNLRYESILQLCEVCKVNMEHAHHVRKLSLAMFDALQSYHGFCDIERELLEAAALLHDTGYLISSDGHHKHSYYIIRNYNLAGFTVNESEMIANIARYHRKSHPKPKHETFQRVSAEQHEALNWLAGILRIAEGLDRRQQQIVENISVEVTPSEIILSLKTAQNIDADIEVWGANRRKPLLQSIIDKVITIQIEDYL